jgi:cytosine/adenosine deaminase-related metal-dependent hydrolase
MVKPWTLRARWIFPVERPPVEGGVVTVSGRRILAIEPRGHGNVDIDLGNVAILPGLVNAHTHLDLSCLSGQGPPPANFVDWLRAVIEQRETTTVGDALVTVLQGLRQCRKSGTTLLGDVTQFDIGGVMIRGASHLRSVIFEELLGLPKTRAHKAWAWACPRLRLEKGTETSRPGLSPHAPYSVRASLFRAAARLCQSRQVPLAIHLAESREELELLEHHRGPFVPFLIERDAWDPEGLVKSISELLQINAEVPHVLFIHGNYLKPDLAFPPGASVIFCPRTHAVFGHAPHPFRELLARGIRVALGTDSLASSPDLNVLAEARFLHQQYPDVPGATLLRMATLSGAEALGWQAETGSLAPGKSADLAVVRLPAEKPLDPHELLFSCGAEVQALLFRGQWVYQHQDYPLPASSEFEPTFGYDEPGLQDL